MLDTLIIDDYRYGDFLLLSTEEKIRSQFDSVWSGAMTKGSTVVFGDSIKGQTDKTYYDFYDNSKQMKYIVWAGVLAAGDSFDFTWEETSWGFSPSLIKFYDPKTIIDGPLGELSLNTKYSDIYSQLKYSHKVQNTDLLQINLFRTELSESESSRINDKKTCWLYFNDGRGGLSIMYFHKSRLLYIYHMPGLD